MGIISTIGRRSIKVRLLIFGIYTALTLGAATMIYPFWLMVTGTTKSGVDATEMEPIPSYLTNDLAFYRKTLEGLFNETALNAKICYNTSINEFKTVTPPTDLKEKYVAEWEAFLKEKEYPFIYYISGYSRIVISRGTSPYNLRQFKNMMYKRYDGKIADMNAKEGTEFVAWPNFLVNEDGFIYRRTQPNINVPFLVEWYKFKDSTPEADRTYTTAVGYYKYNYLITQFTDRIDSYNKANKTNYKSYDEVVLTRDYPKHLTEAERHNWELFVRNVLNMFWVRVDDSAAPVFHDFLKAKYRNIEKLNELYGSKYKNFKEVPLVERIPYSGIIQADWGNFITGWIDPTTDKTYQVPAEALKILSVEFEFQDYLMAKYKTLEAVNAACGTQYTAITDIFPPQREYHYKEIMASKLKWRQEFTIRNYIAVVDYIVLHGRALMNTAIYCSLAVLCALIVNPLAAYALSRFRPPSAFKVLLFLMLTMAFPQMVTQIPNFLMLRELGLLNTFGALILPGLANGYQIFLLKGFFDSLPKELYESAQLDGASETRMFLQLTMNLSKPILAVIALQAFTHAYSNFMMALLICQDRNMWTIMPWLYQLQMSSCEGIIYASLIVASVPTFLIFMLCQNVIMRGIVVPVEK